MILFPLLFGLFVCLHDSEDVTFGVSAIGHVSYCRDSYPLVHNLPASPHYLPEIFSSEGARAIIRISVDILQAR